MVAAQDQGRSAQDHSLAVRLAPVGHGREIDEATLKRIADATGGQSFRARDTDELAGIYAAIERLEPVQRPGQALRPRIERYPWPLAAALLAALLAMAPLPRWSVLRDWWRAPRAQAEPGA